MNEPVAKIVPGASASQLQWVDAGTPAYGDCRRAMQVSEAMTRDVRVCSPAETIRDCAAAMAKSDLGVLPVAENNLLVGMVTDRDIAVRAVAAGEGPETCVRDVMTKEVLYCFEDQDLEHVAKSMGMAKVRRVPVLTRDNRVAGMLSLGNVALRCPEAAAVAVADLSKPGGPHSQTARHDAAARKSANSGTAK